MNLQEIKVHLSEKSIMAVVTIDDIDKSNYVCEALLAGGVNIIELTIRTKNVFKTIVNWLNLCLLTLQFLMDHGNMRNTVF